MKLRMQSKCYLKQRIIRKTPDGGKFADWSEDFAEISATVCSCTGKTVGVQRGNVQQYQKKLLYDEPFEITSENGVETYWFMERLFCMASGDGVCVYAAPDKDPDYRIVAIYPVGNHLEVILEKL